MKRAAAVVILAVLGLAVFLLLVRAPESPTPAGAPAKGRPAAQTVTPPEDEIVPTTTQAESARQGSPLAAELNAPDTPPEKDVTILRDLMSQYLTALQRRAGPPIGDDADLVRALTGRNPLKLTVIPANHPAISPEGRLLDRWGTPYHIHAKSARSFDFRSAGPDKKLFTKDDLVSP